MRNGAPAFLGFLFAQTLFAATSIPINDNGEAAVTFSQGNYNRLLVSHDQIVEAAFPPNRMTIKRDAQDGGVYLMLADASPFTLFLTTEAGRHFALTVKGEEGLGKTIELKVQNDVVAPSFRSKKENNAVENNIPEAIVSLMAHMERREKIKGVDIKYPFGRVERLRGNLSLIPKEFWVLPELTGEISEVYNGGKTPITLTESWFAKAGVTAIQLSQTTVSPKGRVYLYRVGDVDHG